MRYNTIREMDIANGPGCRISIFIQGCDFNCPGCFNDVAKDFNAGKEFSSETLDLLIDLAQPSYISGLSILGGEPLHPKNRKDVIELAKSFKLKYPEKSIWLWTGYEWEDVYEDLKDSAIDVIVDGRFIEKLKDLRLKYRGSSNQRIIDVHKSSATTVVTIE